MEASRQPPWGTLLKVLGALFASAAWVQLVGGAVLWIRLDQVDITPTPAVALLPKELLFAVGIRSLLAPVIAGLVAFGLLLAWERLGRSHEVQVGTPDWLPDVAKEGCPEGQQPRGLKTVLALIVLAACAAAVSWDDLSTAAVFTLIAGSLVAAGVIYLLVTENDGFSDAAATLFVATAAFGGIAAFVVEAGTPAELDLGVGVRKSGAAVGGYFLGKSEDQLYLITANAPSGGVTDASAALTGGAVAVGKEKCDLTAIRVASGDCYVQQVTGVPTGDLVRFTIGPRGVEVGPAGFRAANVLARRAALGLDEQLPPEAAAER